MPIERFFLIGAGGHSLVVLDALQQSKPTAEIRILDQSPKRVGQKLLDVTVEAFDLAMNVADAHFHVCIGNNIVRGRLFNTLKGAGGTPRTIVHPDATIARTARVGAGTFAAARSIVAPAAEVGEGVIINHGAVIDHECVVGRFCHLAPGVTLAGAVKIGDSVLVGAGANILYGISIGDGATIGAGAVVTVDVPSGMTYAGVPARRFR